MKRILSLIALLSCLALLFTGCFVKPELEVQTDSESQTDVHTDSDTESEAQTETETESETQTEVETESETESESESHSETEIETETETETDSESEKIWAVKNGAPQFTIIYGDTEYSDSADYLANTLQSKTGIGFQVRRNPDIVNGHKIYVGLHDAVEDIYSLYGENISYNGYGAIFKDGDIYICGYNSTTVSKAVKKFLSEITADHVVKKQEAYIPDASFVVNNPDYEIKNPMLLGLGMSEFSIARGTNELAITQLVDMCAQKIGTASGAYVRVDKTSAEECRIELSADSSMALLDYSISSDGKVISIKYGGVSGLFAAFDRLISMLNEDTSDGIDLSGSASDSIMTDAPLQREDGADLRIMSFNLMGEGLEESYQCQIDLRSAIAAEYILTLAPDSIGFQEFNSGNRATLKSLISGKYEIVQFTDGSTGGSMKNQWVGTAYLKDKYDLKDSNAVHIMAEKYAGDPGAQDYYFTWALLEDKATGEQYIHANLHLDYRNETDANGKHLRLIQCEKINAELELVRAKYPNAVIAMTGDYNSRIGNDVFDAEKGGLTLKCASLLAPEGKSHDDRSSFHNLCVYSNDLASTNDAIDHVLVSESTVNVKCHSIIRDSLICHASDHYPVVVDIERR